MFAWLVIIAGSNNINNGNSKDGCEKSLQLQVSVRTHLAKLRDFDRI